MWGADAPCKAYKEKSCRESADELAVHFHVACWDYPHAIVVLRYTRIRSWSLDDRSPWQNLGQTLSSHERPSPEPPAGRRPLRPGFKRVYVMNDLESERIHSNVDVCAANLQYCNGTEYVGQGGDRPRYTAHLLYHVGSSYYTYGRKRERRARCVLLRVLRLPGASRVRFCRSRLPAASTMIALTGRVHTCDSLAQTRVARCTNACTYRLRRHPVLALASSWVHMSSSQIPVKACSTRRQRRETAMH